MFRLESERVSDRGELQVPRESNVGRENRRHIAFGYQITSKQKGNGGLDEGG
jgi:hypothetical protein